MSAKTSVSVLLKLTRMGWVLLVDGEPYAVGSREYCIAVAQTVRRDRDSKGVRHD